MTADLRERCAEAVRARCQHDAGLTDCEWCVSLAVEALVREFAAEQLRDVVAWRGAGRTNELADGGEMAQELLRRADAMEKK